MTPGISSGSLFTDIFPPLLFQAYRVNNYLVLPRLVQSFSPLFSTLFLPILSLLHSQLYLFSTAPTITKTKEK